MFLVRQISSARIPSGMSRYGGMMRFKVKAHIHFFDRRIIRSNWPKFNRDPLMHAGNLVMRIARGSIRRRSKLRGKPSRPGSPPYSRQPGTTPPFKQIFSQPFHLGTSVIVGMVGYTRQNPPPGLMEHGGWAQRFVYIRNPQRRKRSGKWGKKRISYKKKMVHYPQRPFMEPALLRAKSRLPNMWNMSVSRSV